MVYFKASPVSPELEHSQCIFIHLMNTFIKWDNCFLKMFISLYRALSPISSSYVQSLFAKLSDRKDVHA